MAKSTLVLIHGSWHCPDHFDLLIPCLSRHGYESVAVSLPSTQSPEKPPKTLADDTAAVREAVLDELSQGNNVVVVAHSYGGCPANNALKGLDRKSRTAAGHDTAVNAIVFICAIPLPIGGTFIGVLGGKPHPLHDLSKSKDFAEVGPPGPGHYFYNDLPPESVQKYSAMIRPQAWIAYEGQTSYAAFVDIPSWYLYCEKDQALPPPAQRGIVQAAEAAGASMKTTSFESSHSPFLSMPEATAEFIVRATKEGV
ncbi:hypothetical protein B0A55_08215 [Friedmanniomyces simplex]|uniref:AB hydrolase-1 domain-containing protein n=1 Tax=Friedmanniomyces simplex TaxID=329884 RepID=A0A4U0X5W4_9PEZI|nr:hypothetical protein B0A55_08215 [Friedmanniomyces simplex]